MNNNIETNNDIENNKIWTVYIHIVPKEISGYNNNKYYIGITSKPVYERWYNGNGYRSNSHFWNAIKKYGWNNIIHKVLFENKEQHEAESLEIKLIALFRSTQPQFGYNYAYGGLCNPGINRKPVLQYDEYGNFIKEWESVKEAQKYYHVQSIYHNCCGKNLTAGGYQWRFKGSDIPVYDVHLRKKNQYMQTIFVYTIGGKYIDSFKTKAEAKRNLNIKADFNINDCFYDITNNESCGYRWTNKYYESLPPLQQNKEKKHYFSIRKPIVKIDPNYNDVLDIYVSIAEAQYYLKDLKQIYQKIGACLRNECDTAYGYKWKYIQDIQESDITDSFLLQKYNDIMKALKEKEQSKRKSKIA